MKARRKEAESSKKSQRIKTAGNDKEIRDRKKRLSQDVP